MAEAINKHNGPLYNKLSQILAEVTRVEKRGRNDFHKYDYVMEADLADAIRPLLAKHGIAITFGVAGDPVVIPNEKGDIVQVLCEIRIGDSEGHELTTRVPGWGQDRGDKGGYKAMTGAVKYWLYKTFLVSTGDDPEDDHADVSNGHAAVKSNAPVATVAKPNGKAQPEAKPKATQDQATEEQLLAFRKILEDELSARNGPGVSLIFESLALAAIVGLMVATIILAWEAM